MNNNQSNKPGFTLIETLVALIVLSVVTLTITKNAINCLRLANTTHQSLGRLALIKRTLFDALFKDFSPEEKKTRLGSPEKITIITQARSIENGKSSLAHLKKSLKIIMVEGTFDDNKKIALFGIRYKKPEEKT